MKVQLTCDYCGSTFERESREIKRSKKKGRKNFCSRNCSGKANVCNIPLESRTYDISFHSSNRRDEFTPFRAHLTRAKRRHHEVNLDLEYLQEVWNKQNGKCSYSGVILQKPLYRKKNDPRYVASLDRIDSSKGYVKGNIQFVSASINYMKSFLSHEQTVELCKTIAKHWT